MGNIIAWLVLGLVAGAIAKAIYPGRQGGGILATMGLGILGAMVGGYLGKMLLGASGAAAAFSLGSIISAVIGSMLLIFVWGLITRPTA